MDPHNRGPKKNTSHENEVLPQDRKTTRWEDNIREWTGLEFGKSQRAVENREKWRNLVAKSSVVS